MFTRLLVIAVLAFFVSGCAPAQKEKVVTPKKNPNAEKVEQRKGNGEDPGRGVSRIDRGQGGNTPAK